MKKLLLLTLALLWLFPAAAQTMREFRAEPQGYLEDLERFLKEAKVKEKDALENLMFSFSDVWQSGAIDEKEAAVIYKISNAFLKKRMTAFEGWHDFLLTIAFFENEASGETPDGFFLAARTRFTKATSSPCSTEQAYWSRANSKSSSLISSTSPFR